MHAHLCGRLPRCTLVAGYEAGVPVFMLSGDVAAWFRPLGALLDNVARGYSYNPVSWHALTDRANAAQGGAAPPWQPLLWAGGGEAPPLASPDAVLLPPAVSGAAGKPPAGAGPSAAQVLQVVGGDGGAAVAYGGGGFVPPGFVQQPHPRLLHVPHMASGPGFPDPQQQLLYAAVGCSPQQAQAQLASAAAPATPMAVLPSHYAQLQLDPQQRADSLELVQPAGLDHHHQQQQQQQQQVLFAQQQPGLGGGGAATGAAASVGVHYVLTDSGQILVQAPHQHYYNQGMAIHQAVGPPASGALMLGLAHAGSGFTLAGTGPDAPQQMLQTQPAVGAHGSIQFPGQGV
jgi:hypothetical protein